MIKKENIWINDYMLKIKSIYESLASINVTMDDDDNLGLEIMMDFGRVVSALEGRKRCGRYDGA